MVSRVFRELGILVLVIAVGATWSPGITQETQQQIVNQRTIQLDTLLAGISSAPPEVAADVSLRIANSKLIDNKQKKIELLESALARSPEIQKKLKLRLREGLTDTPSGYLSAAYDLKLDALSLKLRVVQAMLPLDAQRARVMFAEIPKAKLPALTCNESLAYDLSEFYATLRQIQQKSFSSDEKLQKKDLIFVQSYVGDLVSPAQVGPVLRLITDSDFSPDDLALLTANLSSALTKILDDHRSFALSVKHDSVPEAFTRLIDTLNKKSVPTEELLKSFRSYLVRELSSAQCSDMTQKLGQQTKSEKYIDYLNKWFADPIRDDEIKPARVDSAATVVQFWSSTESRRLLMGAKSLRFGRKESPLTLEERSSSEWQQNMVQLLADLENWEGTSEPSESVFFHEKCNLFGALFQLAPDRALRTRVLLSFANYLRSAWAQQENRIGWLLHANDIRNKIRTLAGRERSKALDVLRNSGNESLQLYAQLDDLLEGG
jgi:hypothetical protein